MQVTGDGVRVRLRTVRWRRFTEDAADELPDDVAVDGVGVDEAAKLVQDGQAVLGVEEQVAPANKEPDS